MRTKFFTLVALLVAGAAQADVVVIENAGGSGSSTAGGQFRISWTQTTTGPNLSSFRLFGYDPNPAGIYELEFNLFKNGSLTQAFVNGTNDFSFAGTAIAGVSLTAGTYELDIKNINAGYNYNSTPTNTTNSAYGFSSATQSAVTGSEYLTYQLSAVPEPGTMLLGGIAAACGGAGAWWKRRKRPVLLPENPAID
jgi:hypothetical protein